ncbi:hypothetical protein HanIR_Chr09g0414101 [Helianthus annuus]|nr:hypothetical protein HanIR_Chr09g0414101 [Helianthus annuus]
MQDKVARLYKKRKTVTRGMNTFNTLSFTLPALSPTNILTLNTFRHLLDSHLKGTTPVILTIGITHSHSPASLLTLTPELGHGSPLRGPPWRG